MYPNRHPVSNEALPLKVKINENKIEIYIWAGFDKRLIVNDELYLVPKVLAYDHQKVILARSRSSSMETNLEILYADLLDLDLDSRSR